VAITRVRPAGPGGGGTPVIPPPAAAGGGAPAEEDERPRVGLLSPRRQSLRRFIREGMRFRIQVDEPVTLRVTVYGRLTNLPGRRRASASVPRGKLRRMVRRTVRVEEAGVVTVRLRPRAALRLLLRREDRMPALLAVRAIDSKSRRGPAQTLVLTSRPVNPADWVRSSGWSRVSSSTYYGDGAYRTSSSRAEIRIPGARDVRSVRVKAPTGPGYGRVQVLVNGVAYGSFSLSAAASAQRTFAVSLPSPRSGTVTLRTLDSGREVRISGIGLGR
jgi:hypothetical protein